ncbi:Peptidyl-prolyl cis-trans isomerase [hydrothermal vent metagenome]|uniref:peptidylprolyl isomerase n=1 Tax=hydrothermal vent metagenome TaxID=652676 RepID=A0A3B0ULW5_9ZZZZ
MAKNRQKPPARAKRQAALAQEKAQRNKRMAIVGGVVAIIVIAVVVWQLWPQPDAEVVATVSEAIVSEAIESGAAVVEGERPLAAIPVAERNNYFNTPPPMIIDTGKDYEAVFQTDQGEMRIRLFDDEAPLTVNNFVFLANQGFYDGTMFHRVLQDFMAQGGDPSGTGAGGPGYQFADEFDTDFSFDRRGLLAMANAGPGTNGSQFFITFVPTPWLDGLHTIFGELIEGDDVLAALTLRDPGSATPSDTIIRIDIVEK